jgi:hypothetical protein
MSFTRTIMDTITTSVNSTRIDAIHSDEGNLNCHEEMHLCDFLKGCNSG